jgi:hypothetical protein
MIESMNFLSMTGEMASAEGDRKDSSDCMCLSPKGEFLLESSQRSKT